MLMLDGIRESIADDLYALGSYLTDPICFAHKHFAYFYLSNDNQIYPPEHPVNTTVFKIVSLIKAFSAFILGIPLGAMGIVCRFLAKVIAPHNFSYQKGEGIEISLSRKSKIFKWNICGIGGGYPILQNGLSPWEERLEDIVGKIKEQNAEVVFLEEVYDRALAQSLIKELKRKYAHFYYNIGAKSIGAPAGQFVASRVPIEDPEYIAFPMSTTIGRIKFVGKGVFAFKSNDYAFYHSHMQHSEDPSKPTVQEKVARRVQSKIIEKLMLQRENDRTVNFFLGDLNMSEDELSGNPILQHFQSPCKIGAHTYFPIEEITIKNLSYEQAKRKAGRIDYTRIGKSSGKKLRTRVVKGFSFKPGQNISDHHGLVSEIDVSIWDIFVKKVKTLFGFST